MFGNLRRLIILLSLFDLIGTQFALLAADSLRRILPLGRELGTPESQLNIYIHLMVALLFPVVFLAVSVYDVRRDVRPVGDAGALFIAVSTATMALAGALYFSFRDIPRLLVVYFYFFELLILTTARLLMALTLRLMHASGNPLTRILLVGAGESADAVSLALSTRLGHSIQIIGCADDSPLAQSTFTILGRVEDVPHLVRELNVDEVIICLPAENYTQVERLSFALQTEAVRVRLVPDFLKLVMVQSSVDLIGGVPLIGLREPRIDGFAWTMKRVFDLIAILFGMIVALPLMAGIALAIKLTSPGPIIFKQKRVGENGKVFGMYKFRTMEVGAENKVDKDNYVKRPDDPRITQLGRFLRRASLDELPQLFNVLKGEMSLVGPRPEMTFIVEKYEPWQRQRLAVPPGMTGWWQVNGRSDLPLQINTQYDLYYIRNYSLLLDLKILWRTVSVVIKGKGAY